MGVYPLKHIISWDTLGSSFIFSASQMLPLIPTSRIAREAAAIELFSSHIPGCLYFLTVVQSILAFVFLFLIGLALRNRFRL